MHISPARRFHRLICWHEAAPPLEGKATEKSLVLLGDLIRDCTGVGGKRVECEEEEGATVGAGHAGIHAVKRRHGSRAEGAG